MKNKMLVIRFRIWDGRKMWYPEDDELLYVGLSGYIVRFESTGHCDGKGDPDYQMIYEMEDDENHIDYIAMLSTGLKDRTGKDIYEGDILEFDAEEWGGDQIPMFVVKWNPANGAWDTGGGTNAECGEWKRILGNIYENKYTECKGEITQIFGSDSS